MFDKQKEPSLLFLLFAVVKLCAVKGLQMLGYKVDPEYVKKLKVTEEQNRRQSLLKKQEKECEIDSDSDETFFYIAWYTFGGAPYLAV